MSKISIPFNKWSRIRLSLKLKTATTRTKRYGKEGDFFKVGLQDYRLEHVLLTTLEIVARYFWKEEGAESEDDFIKQWESIYPLNKWQPGKVVYIHFFKEYNVRPF